MFSSLYKSLQTLANPRECLQILTTHFFTALNLHSHLDNALMIFFIEQLNHMGVANVAIQITFLAPD